MPDRRLLEQSIAAVGLCAVLVAFCFLFVDQPVARWVYEHRLSQHPWIRQPTYLPEVLYNLAAVVIVILAVARVWRPWMRWQKIMLAMGLNLLIVEAIKERLKWLFGRPWPETWIDHNPSFISNDFTAFQWFHGDLRFGSFPSGHTALICAVASIAWIAWPKWRWAWGFLVSAIIFGLVANNYHFVGDTVGGLFLGFICGAWTARLMGLSPVRADSSRRLSTQ